MLYTINELKHRIFQPVYDVYTIFQNFFGEDFTDLQGIPPDEFLLPDGVTIEELPSFDISDERLEGLIFAQRETQPHIMVWWPTVKVSNENNKYVHIQDLYAKIPVTLDGRIPYESIGFQLNRTTFSKLQFASKYIHSHVPSRYGLPVFKNPCLGRGPIRKTIAHLKNYYDEAFWMLFCRELSLYVTVESLKGGPYRKLEEIGGSYLSSRFSSYHPDIDSILRLLPADDRQSFLEEITEFTKYYLIHGHLKMSFINGEYTQGMPYFESIIDISNAFIEWFNQFGSSEKLEYLHSHNIIEKVLVREGKFYRYDDPNREDSDERLEGHTVLTFKERAVPLVILSNTTQEPQQPVLLLNNYLASYILDRIKTIINYRFTDEYTITSDGRKELASSTYQTVCYL